MKKDGMTKSPKPLMGVTSSEGVILTKPFRMDVGLTLPAPGVSLLETSNL